VVRRGAAARPGRGAAHVSALTARHVTPYSNGRAGSRLWPASTDSATSSAITVPVILCYCGAMKNVTVSVPDDVYRTARIRAAHQGTSVSALVTAYLRSLATDTEFARLQAQQLRIQRQIKRFHAADRLSRDELHDRALR
jgi:plasmid stability protein